MANPGLNATVANSILNSLCRATSWTAPTAFYVKLHIGEPGSAGTANAAAETTRKSATFGAASGGALTTTGDLAWTSVAGTETISHVTFWDHITSGTFLASDALNVSKALTAGDNFTIATGDLDIDLSPIAA